MTAAPAERPSQTPNGADASLSRPAADATRGRRRSALLRTLPSHPLRTGFAVTIGVVLAIALAIAFASMSTVLMSVTLAMFLALGMEPAVQVLSRRGVPRPWGITTVTLAFLGLVAAIVLTVVPALIDQIVELIESAPAALAAIERTEWFRSLDERTLIDLGRTVDSAWNSLTSLSAFLAIAGGVAEAGVGIVGIVSSSMIVVVLTLYFVASLPAMKTAAASLLPSYRRPGFLTLTEEITASVGGVVAGGITLATLNAIVVLILQLLVGSPVAALLAIGAFFITLVPLIGSVLFLIVGTIASLFLSPTAALVFGIGYLIYMQFEAYWITPRIMGRAVAVPGVLVIIGAMVGATLFGLLGALVAIPVTASILIIIRRVVVPAQDRRTAPDDD